RVEDVAGHDARRPDEEHTLVGPSDDQREGQLIRRREEPDDPWQAAGDSLPGTGLRHGCTPLLRASVIRKPARPPRGQPRATRIGTVMSTPTSSPAARRAPP